jgi:hypothetical protein
VVSQAVILFMAYTYPLLVHLLARLGTIASLECSVGEPLLEVFPDHGLSDLTRSRQSSGQMHRTLIRHVTHQLNLRGSHPPLAHELLGLRAIAAEVDRGVCLREVDLINTSHHRSCRALEEWEDSGQQEQQEE